MVQKYKVRYYNWKNKVLHGLSLSFIIFIDFSDERKTKKMKPQELVLHIIVNKNEIIMPYLLQPTKNTKLDLFTKEKTPITRVYMNGNWAKRV